MYKGGVLGAEPVHRDRAGPAVEESECADDLDHRQYQWGWIALALIAVTLVWIALFVVRLHAHQANVDDFGYAWDARYILHSSDPIGAAFSIAPDAPLVPVLSVPGVAVGGLYGALAIEFPWLLALCFGAYLLARTWVSESASALIALVVGLNAAVLAYALMLNFALASTTCVVWCFVTYLRSEGMSRWSWSVGLGISFAALVISRSVAPVYAIPLAAVIAADVLWVSRRRSSSLGAPALAAVGLVVILAGPWWAAEGSKVAHYLLNAGYQPSSGYTAHGFALSPASVVSRAHWELLNLGWIQSVALGAALVLSLWMWFTHRQGETYPFLWMLGAWCAASLLILSSSGNLGTAFGLPIIVVLLVGCGVILARSVRHHRGLVATLVVVLVAGSSAGQFTASTSAWWPGPPYRAQVLAGGGTTSTNVDALATRVGDAIGSERTVLGVDDAVLNYNGIVWANPHARLTLPTGSDATASAERLLNAADQLVTGRTSYMFGSPVDQQALEAEASRLGFQPVRLWAVTPTDDVVLWRKGAPPTSVPGLRPHVEVVRPKDGSVVSGPILLVAEATGLLGIQTVTFEITGGPSGYHQTVPAGRTLYGWLSTWNPGRALPGRYEISCTATALGHGLAAQRSITVTLQPSG